MNGLELITKINDSSFYDDFCAKKDDEFTYATSLPGKETERVKTWRQIVNDGDFHHNLLWKSPDREFRIVLDKFGKQHYQNVSASSVARTNYEKFVRGINMHDMRPSIYTDKMVEMDLSFKLIFDLLAHLKANNQEEELVALGILMIRNALLLDHEISPKSYIYSPHADVISYLKENVDDYNGFDIETLLHYIDAIALNEDIKYSVVPDKNGRNYDIKNLNTGIGRTNNVLTYVHVIAFLLGKASLSKLLSDYSRIPAGVAPLPLSISLPLFKELKSQYKSL